MANMGLSSYHAVALVAAAAGSALGAPSTAQDVSMGINNVMGKVLLDDLERYHHINPVLKIDATPRQHLRRGPDAHEHSTHLHEHDDYFHHDDVYISKHATSLTLQLPLQDGRNLAFECDQMPTVYTRNFSRKIGGRIVKGAERCHYACFQNGTNTGGLNMISTCGNTLHGVFNVDGTEHYLESMALLDPVSEMDRRRHLHHTDNRPSGYAFYAIDALPTIFQGGVPKMHGIPEHLDQQDVNEAVEQAEASPKTHTIKRRQIINPSKMDKYVRIYLFADFAFNDRHKERAEELATFLFAATTLVFHSDEFIDYNVFLTAGHIEYVTKIEDSPPGVSRGPFGAGIDNDQYINEIGQHHARVGAEYKTAAIAAITGLDIESDNNQQTFSTGYGTVGCLCSDTCATINEAFGRGNDYVWGGQLKTYSTLAHEIGHNFGMLHTDGLSMMSYDRFDRFQGWESFTNINGGPSYSFFSDGNHQEAQPILAAVPFYWRFGRRRKTFCSDGCDQETGKCPGDGDQFDFSFIGELTYSPPECKPRQPYAFAECVDDDGQMFSERICSLGTVAPGQQHCTSCNGGESACDTRDLCKALFGAGADDADRLRFSGDYTPTCSKLTCGVRTQGNSYSIEEITPMDGTPCPRGEANRGNGNVCVTTTEGQKCLPKPPLSTGVWRREKIGDTCSPACTSGRIEFDVRCSTGRESDCNPSLKPDRLQECAGNSFCTVQYIYQNPVCEGENFFALAECMDADGGEGTLEDCSRDGTLSGQQVCQTCGDDKAVCDLNDICKINFGQSAVYANTLNFGQDYSATCASVSCAVLQASGSYQLQEVPGGAYSGTLCPEGERGAPAGSVCGVVDGKKACVGKPAPSAGRWMREKNSDTCSPGCKTGTVRYSVTCPSGSDCPARARPASSEPCENNGDCRIQYKYQAATCPAGESFGFAKCAKAESGDSFTVEACDAASNVVGRIRCQKCGGSNKGDTCDLDDICRINFGEGAQYANNINFRQDFSATCGLLSCAVRQSNGQFQIETTSVYDGSPCPEGERNGPANGVCGSGRCIPKPTAPVWKRIKVSDTCSPGCKSGQVQYRIECSSGRNQDCDNDAPPPTTSACSNASEDCVRNAEWIYKTSGDCPSPSTFCGVTLKPGTVTCVHGETFETFDDGECESVRKPLAIELRGESDICIGGLQTSSPECPSADTICQLLTQDTDAVITPTPTECVNTDPSDYRYPCGEFFRPGENEEFCQATRRIGVDVAPSEYCCNCGGGKLPTAPSGCASEISCDTKGSTELFPATVGVDCSLGFENAVEGGRCSVDGQCQVPTVGTTYSYQKRAGTCSSTCGAGRSTSSFVCVSSKGQDVDESFCSGPKPANTVEGCVARTDCRWSIVAVGECVGECGEVVETPQTLECVDENNVDVDDDLCSDSMKPTAPAEPCFNSCTYTWSFDEMAAPVCSSGCGLTTETRVRTCRRSDGVQVANDSCNGIAQITLPNSSRCRVRDTCELKVAGAFGPCSTSTCGEGTQTAPLACVDSITNSKAPSMSYCDGLDASTFERACTVTETCGVQAPSSNAVWSECSEICGGGNQELLNGDCVDTTTNTIVSNDLCEGIERPTQDCNTGACEFTWDKSEWSRCDTTCGEGKQTRTIRRCLGSDGRATSPRNCGDRPPSSQTCRATSECKWLLSSNWGPCEGECGSSFESRIPVCSNSRNVRVPDSFCTSADNKPMITRACEEPCAFEWVIRDQSCEAACGVSTLSTKRECQLNGKVVAPTKCPGPSDLVVPEGCFDNEPTVE